MTRVLACLAIGAWVFLLWPFPITTFMATCMACVTYPAYRKLHRKMSPSWAMTTYTVGLAAITILPIATVDTQPGSPGVVRFRGRMAQKPPWA